jgi:hypothetical protein
VPLHFVINPALAAEGMFYFSGSIPLINSPNFAAGTRIPK